MPFDIVVGVHADNWAIGADGKIPWKCPADMKFFKEVTTTTQDPAKTNAVVMGRTTFDSIGKALPNRLNIVLSKTALRGSCEEGVFFMRDFNEAIEQLEEMPEVETIYVIGGEMVYRQAISHPKCDKIYLNTIHKSCDLSKADRFFPDINKYDFELIKKASIDLCVTAYLYKKYMM
jgi:dihydrofolate reductase